MANDNKIGALWLKTAKSGIKYFNGSIEWKGEKFYISIFKNNKKTQDKQPDYHVVWNREDYKSDNQNSFENEEVPF